MSRDEAARLGRVARVVALGARIADAADPLGQEARRALPAICRLSPEGVELALTQHLERDPSDADLAALIASCGHAPRCHVFLSSNVCTAPLRALAIAVATSPSVSVHPSRRDPVLAGIFTRELADDAAFRAHGGEIATIAQLLPMPGDEVHVYGSDETIAHFRSLTGESAILRAHGTGLGIAVIGRSAELGSAACALAADVVPFDQRGCLSPRAAIVEGDVDRAAAFARALDDALRRAGDRVPRGPLDDDARAEIAMYRATTDAIGESLEGPHHLVGLDLAPRSLPLPPAARVVHIVPAGADRAAALVAQWSRYITTVGEAGEGAIADVILLMAPWARRSPLGRMQRPPLDGPVDRRPAFSSAALS